MRRSIFVRTLAAGGGALILAAGALAQQADTATNPFAGDPAAAAAGRVIYNTTCAACHAPAGVGGRGPALNTGHFAHGDNDADIFQVIRGGIADTQMPDFSSLSADDTWRLVNYVKSLAAPPPAPAPVTTTADTVAGARLFFGSGNCTSCHEINGRGLDLGPDLSAEGTRPAPAIHDGILHRAAAAGRGGRGATSARTTSVTLTSGKTVSGVIRGEDSVTLHLEQRDGKLLLLEKKTLRSMSTPAPLAGPEIAARLSSGDIENLAAFLGAQTARNLGEAAKATPAPVLSDAVLAAGQKNPANWTSYWGGYDGHHFSELKQVTAKNVKQLQARWTASLPGNSALEASPLVVDGVMYVSGPPGDVYAIDARSGTQIWRFHRDQEVKNPGQINPFNKGVAVLDGRVFFGTLDNNLIALDAHTGRQLWEKHLAEALDGVTLTGAPLAVKGKIIMGMSGGEMGTRGWLDAYDPATGTRLWRLYTIPQPGETGADSWPAGDAWQHGGGATWLTGQYDPELNTLYWSTGNPGPNYNPAIRKGDNLYSDSVLAIDPDTGKVKWYYQFTPNDGHDWDATEDNILADQTINKQKRKLLLHADRNGMYYVLDRVTGKLVLGKPFVKVTWTHSFDANGKPIVDPASAPTASGAVVFPTTAATDFQAPSYDATSGVLYLNFNDAQGFVASGPAVYQRGSQYLGRGTGTAPPGPVAVTGTMALDSKTGRVLWRHPLSRFNLSAGVLGTRGGVIFAATAEGNFMALDAKSGKALWNFRMPGGMNASPMSYAVDGKQYVAVAAGNLLYSFALPE